MGRSLYSYFFFFQAEDGIRDYKVTGVQTCALPISVDGSDAADRELGERLAEYGAAFAVDADDLDARTALPACDRRRGHVRLLGADGEFLILLPGTGFRQPCREPGAILPGVDVPARGFRIPGGAQGLHLALFLRGHEKIKTVRLHSCRPALNAPPPPKRQARPLRCRVCRGPREGR